MPWEQVNGRGVMMNFNDQDRLALVVKTHHHARTQDEGQGRQAVTNVAEELHLAIYASMTINMR
jgi:hypothetical protein